MKTNCECGKPSTLKGYCNNCYQKYYQRKIHGWKSGRERKKRDTKYNVDEVFNNVLTEVKQGVTIEKSCKKCKINRSSFYRVLTTTQKKELFAAKLIFKTNIKL